MDEIQTEVDRLIEILQARPGKAVRMGELANLTGLNIAQVRKWLHILEERRQVKITYNLSDEEVEWKGALTTRSDRMPHPDDAQGISTTRPDAASSAAYESAADSNMEAARYNEQRFHQGPRWNSSRTGQEQPEPLPPKDVPSVIERPAQERERLQMPQEPAQRQQVQRPQIPAARRPAPEMVPEPVLPPLPKMDENSMRVSNKLKGKIAAARAKMEEIEQLKGEKKRLLVEVYRPMQTKLEAETGAITEKLIELENQLLGIREQAARVPSEVAELAGEQERIVQIAAEMRRVYSETDRQMTQSVQALSIARTMAQERVRDANALIVQQQDALAQMNRHMDDLAGAHEQAQARIQQAHEALAAQEAHLTDLQESMRSVAEFQLQMQQHSQAGQDEIVRQRSALAEIERQLGRMDEVQTWVEAHHAEYNNRMGRLNEYIQTAGTQYNTLKAAIDSGFIHRYLRDLRALSESYEFELTQAKQLETNIDQRLEETKKELTALISQARDVADAQELSMAQAAPKPIDAIEFDEEHERAVNDVREQQGERLQLREQIRRTLGDEDEQTAPEEAVPTQSVDMPHPTLTPRSSSTTRKRSRQARKRD